MPLTSLSKLCSHWPLMTVLTSALLVGGCVTAYPKAEDLAPVSVEAARDGKGSARSVRWGGTIVDVLNTDSGTRLQVVSRPLRANGRPMRDDRSDGRFIARVNAFLDPEIYKPGRDISVVGRIGKVEEGAVGEAAYAFATIDVENYQFWKPEPPVVNLPAAYYGNRLFRHSSDWPFDYYRHRPLLRPGRRGGQGRTGAGPQSAPQVAPVAVPETMPKPVLESDRKSDLKAAD